MRWKERLVNQLHQDGGPVATLRCFAVTQMNMKTFEVSKDFVLEAHNAACKDWKKRIEDEFPELFPKPKTIIGRKYIPSDNSWCVRLEDNEQCPPERLAGTQTGEKPKECIVISNPFKYMVGSSGNQYWFINVLYGSNTFRVLYFEDNIQRDE